MRVAEKLDWKGLILGEYAHKAKQPTTNRQCSDQLENIVLMHHVSFQTKMR
jgi:hypothetical protein